MFFGSPERPGTGVVDPLFLPRVDLQRSERPTYPFWCFLFVGYGACIAASEHTGVLLPRVFRLEVG
jgi:hypothetical protein